MTKDVSTDEGKRFQLVDGELWPRTPHGSEVNLEIVGFTGEFWAGKTVATMDIAPGNFASGQHVGKARTRIYDLEKSSGNYGAFGADRVDVHAEMAKVFGNKQYEPIDIFNWLVADISAIQLGRYDVIAVDPINDIEDAIASKIRSRPEEFGLTSEQIRKGIGLLWGAMKSYYKLTLLRATTGRCRTFAFTTHMRDQFSGNAPTGKREPKGKETLFELSTLYLLLERIPVNGILPSKPTAVVLKSRIEDFWMENGGMNSAALIPPKITPYSANILRGYIANGYNNVAPKEGERFVEKVPTEAEMLAMRRGVAEAEADANKSRLELLRRNSELRASVEQQEKSAGAVSVESREAKQADKASQAIATANDEVKATGGLGDSSKSPPNYAEVPLDGGGGLSVAQANTIRDYINAIWPNATTRKASIESICQKASVSNLRELNAEKAKKLIDHLFKILPEDFVPF